MISTGTRVLGGVTVGVINNNTNCNLAGYTVQNAPPFTASIGFVYAFENRLGAWAISANDHYNSRYAKVNDDSIYDNSHHLIDVSVGWTAPSKRYDVNLWAKNLTNEYVYIAGQISQSFAIVPGALRTFGATFGVHL